MTEGWPGGETEGLRATVWAFMTGDQPPRSIQQGMAVGDWQEMVASATEMILASQRSELLRAMLCKDFAYSGMKVLLAGLTERPELNGQLAVVVGTPPAVGVLAHDIASNDDHSQPMAEFHRPSSAADWELPVEIFGEQRTTQLRVPLENVRPNPNVRHDAPRPNHDCSLITGPKAGHLDFNGRSQFSGVAQLNGVIRLLDDPRGPLDGPGQILTPEESNAHVLFVKMRNIDRVPADRGPECVHTLHFDMSVPANAFKFRLRPDDGGDDCIGRGVNGVLAVDARPGDCVKVALDIAAALEAFGAPADQVEEYRHQRSGERYWACVLVRYQVGSEQMYVVLPSVQQQGQSPPLVEPQLGCHASSGVPGGSRQIGTPRARPSHRDPSHHFGCSSQPPPKPPISPRLTMQVQLHYLIPPIASEPCGQHGQSALLSSAPAQPLRLPKVRLAALGSSALPGRGPATEGAATASTARACRLRSRRFLPPR